MQSFKVLWYTLKNVVMSRGNNLSVTQHSSASSVVLYVLYMLGWKWRDYLFVKCGYHVCQAPSSTARLFNHSRRCIRESVFLAN